MSKPRRRPGIGAADASIGVRTPLVDGAEKVTGRARYTADLQPGPALVGAIGRSSVAHARIRRIDASAALALPGVRAVIEDFHAPYGVIPISQNEWPLARGKVRAANRCSRWRTTGDSACAFGGGARRTGGTARVLQRRRARAEARSPTRTVGQPRAPGGAGVRRRRRLRGGGPGAPSNAPRSRTASSN